MRRPLSSFAPAALIALALAATGCQQLFTTSLAAWAERANPPVPKIEDLGDLRSSYSDLMASPASAAASLTQVNDVIGGMPASLEKDEAMAMAASLAIVGSNAAESVFLAFDVIAAGQQPDSATISAIVRAIDSGSEIVEAISYLDPLVLDPDSIAASSISATEYVIAAAVLAASALPVGVTDPTTLSGAELTAYQSNPAVVLAGQLVAAAGDRLIDEGGDPALADSLAQFLNT